MNQVNSLGVEGRQQLFGADNGSGNEVNYDKVSMWADSRQMPQEQKAKLASFLDQADAAVDGGESDTSDGFNATELKVALDMSKGMDIETAAKNHIDWARSQSGQVIHMGGEVLTSEGNGTFKNENGDSLRVTGDGGVSGDPTKGGVAKVEPNQVIDPSNGHTFDNPAPGQPVTFSDSAGNIHEGTGQGNGVIKTDDGQAWLQTPEKGIVAIESDKLIMRNNGETAKNITDAGNDGDSYVGASGQVYTREGTENLFSITKADGSAGDLLLYVDGKAQNVEKGKSYDKTTGAEITTLSQAAAAGSNLLEIPADGPAAG